ncbi:hypothetical protein ACFVRD_43360 [Streptomyces sp. NPDC057908]|uniref:hypothetical protein n=1 Tax=Streptomyces sp. NPDC057908 TaxID=3346276 RepID=UPI0036E54A70
MTVTIQNTLGAPTTAPTTPAPVPVPVPAPASQQSVRNLWAAVVLIGIGCALYAMHEHPALTAPLSALGGLLGAAGGLAAWLRQ